MTDSIVASRYAQAIYELAKEAKLIEDVYRELSFVMETYEANEEFRNFINHPLVNVEDKNKFISNIFVDKLCILALNSIHYLIDKNRLSLIKDITKEYLKSYYAENRKVEAEATFAIKPNEAQLQLLNENLKKRMNKEIILSTKIDKSILGGVVIRIEDQIIDASIRGQINAFRNNY